MDPIDVENSVPSTSIKYACIPRVGIELKPFVGKTFETLEDARNFYIEYARKGNFSVIRSMTNCFESTDPNIDKSPH